MKGFQEGMRWDWSRLEASPSAGSEQGKAASMMRAKRRKEGQTRWDHEGAPWV